MQFSRTLSSAALALALFVAGVLPSVSFAQSEGPNGFDWIGTNTGNIQDQRCISSTSIGAGVFTRLTTSWVPPSGSPTVLYNYTPQTFRGIVGVIPTSSNPNPPAVSTTTGWKVFVYDDFARFRADAENNFRVMYSFNLGNTGMTYQSAPNCKYWVNGNYYSMPCNSVSLNLNAASSVQYKTAAGVVTSTPFKLIGGTRYWITMVGFNENITMNGVPCVLRTNSANPGSFSPVPSPVVQFPMSQVQCSEAGLAYPCNFTLGHSDFYKISNAGGACDPSRTAVNYIDPDIAPVLNTATIPSAPRTCGWAGVPCCDRTWAARSGMSMTVTRTATKMVISDLVATARIAHACQEPNC
jgi:hypothetical protein